MLCTKCGHENPSSAKFCNECGSLVDRRKGERRQGDRRETAAGSQAGAAARRPTLLPSVTPGQENAQGHSPAKQAAEAYLRKERPVRGPEQMPVEDARENGAPLRPNVIVTSRGEDLRPSAVSGPSFLGLADGSSGSGDYLLEDEPSGGWRKWAVLLVILIIALLFYLQWRTSWRAQPSPPAPAQTAPPQTAPQGSAAPASEATGVPAANSQQAAKQPDASNTPPAGNPEASAVAPADKPKSGDLAEQHPAAADPEDGKDADQPEEQPAAEPARQANARKPAAERPSSASEPQRDPMLFMAQKYLYGQGVRKDCDQAMVYLRAANQKPSAPARSQMGALYATGYCLPLDRIRAYQWFTSALNVEPGNASLQRERNNLWAQMTSAERQQAVK